MRLSIVFLLFSIVTMARSLGSSTAPRKVRLLAFGDSLTWGYYAMGLKQRPYTIRLEQLIADKNWHIATQGFPGYTSEELLAKLDKTLRSPGRPGLKTVLTYDLICILGGTNDLGRFSAQTTIKNLYDMHLLAHKSRARTVAISIPEHGQEMQYPEIREKRLAINSALQAFASESNSQTTFFNLAVELPMSSLSLQERPKLWDDGLHFTPFGYDRFGEQLYAHLVKHRLVSVKTAEERKDPALRGSVDCDEKQAQKRKKKKKRKRVRPSTV